VPNFIKTGQTFLDIAIFFEFSRWWLSTILDFENAEILLANGFGGRDPSACLISSKLVNTLWRYCNFLSFQNGHLQSGIF